MSAEGIKYDAQKPPLELVPGAALEEIARVLQFGARKYTRHNWRKGLQQSRVCGAALRHIYQYLDGEDLDDETRLPHLAHAATEILFALTYQLEGRTDLDDRYNATRGNEQ